MNDAGKVSPARTHAGLMEYFEVNALPLILNQSANGQTSCRTAIRHLLAVVKRDAR